MRGLIVSGNVLTLRSPWVVGGGIGPVIGGSLAQNGKWYATCLTSTQLLPNPPSTPLGGGCFVSRNLIGGAISVVNGPYRPQHPDMCLQHHPCLTLPPSQDANSTSKGESQKNGHHVGVREFMYFESYFGS